MADAKLFTAIHIPGIPFVNEIIRPNKLKKHNYQLAENKKITDSLFHYLYKKDAKELHCYYLIADPDDALERYLFVENNELYHDFLSRFRDGQRQYEDTEMNAYLDVDDPKDVLNKLKHAYSNQFYGEDEPMPLCHMYGQRMWHHSAFLVANETALLELREAIDTALKHKESRLGLFPSDGEGYDMYIKCVEDDFDWEKIELPYHDREYYIPDDEADCSPPEVFTKFKYQLRDHRG